MARAPLITELTIEGFKSFGSPAQKLALGPLNFVVGANASGKTNLLDALRFLQWAVVSDVHHAVAQFGGAAAMVNKAGRRRRAKETLKLGLRIDADIRADVGDGRMYWIRKFDYQISVDLSPDAPRPTVQSEELIAELDFQGPQKYRLWRSHDIAEYTDPTIPDGESQKFRVPEQERDRLALSAGLYSIPCSELRRIIEGWRFYDIVPDLARLPSPTSQRTTLGARGENLATVIHRLRASNGGPHSGPMGAGVRGVVPGIQDIKVVPGPGEQLVSLSLVEEGIRGRIGYQSISDGTIRLMALLAISLSAVEMGSLIAVEEPETGLHPYLAEYVVDILRFAAETRQLMVTTHQPDFLDYLEPEEVFLCEKHGGMTKVHCASAIDQIDTKRRHFKLGELWEQEALGGAL